MIAHFLENAGVIGVKPVQLITRQQLRIDQAPFDGAERQGLKAQHGAFAAVDGFRFVNEQQVFNADAEFILLVEAGLVGKIMPGSSGMRSDLLMRAGPSCTER